VNRYIWIMNQATIHALVFALLLCAGCGKLPVHPQDAPHDGPIPAAANPNAAELERFAAFYGNTSEQGVAARFLLDNLPPADRLSMSAADLRENLEYAFLARETLPWGKAVPPDIFLHYVLPHRVSQEPFEPHRAMLYRELAPLCATAGSMKEALSRVGAWCAARTEYRPTSRRDLGVLSILDAGYGRCEETNILFMAAARAVGLPVRQALVPWWQHADGNHAWVEAWTPDGWKFLESGTEFTELNRTWFASEAPRMPKVAAHVFGRGRGADIYRTGPGYSLADSTAAYVRPVSVRVRVANTDGSPAQGRDIYFSVCSMGALRPVTKAATDARGWARTTLGPGVFFVSCAADEGLSWSLLDTRARAAAECALTAGEPTPLPASLAFDYPGPSDAAFDVTPSPALMAVREERAGRWLPLIKSLPETLAGRLAAAGDGAPGWLRLLHASPPSAWTRPLIETLDDKDLLQADPAAMVREMEQAVTAREASERAGLAYDDDTFVRYVLSPRLHLEPWSPWRAELGPWLRAELGLPLEEKIELVRRGIESLKPLRRNLFGPPLTPAQTRAAGFCATPWDKGVLATAALRCLGVPARYRADFGGLDYYDGNGWRFWKLEERQPAGGMLRLIGGTELRPFLDFGVSRVEQGHLRALDDLDWKKEDDGFRCALQLGTYLLVETGRKGLRAEARLRPVTITADSVTTLDAMREDGP
jgi:transglutaminase-like putative cysteine protease